MIEFIKEPQNEVEREIVKYQSLVLWLARRNARKGFSADDLYQSGIIALLRCIKIKKDSLTSGYVAAACRNAMLDLMRLECDEPSEYMIDSIEQTVSNEGEENPDNTASRDSSIDPLIATTDAEKIFAKYLSSFEQNVMEMRWIMGHASKEVALLQNISVDTINRAEQHAIMCLSRATEFQAVSKDLARLIVLQAVVNGNTPADVLENMCLAAEADLQTVLSMTPEIARKNLTLMRRAGLK
jgi:RNA polymerase sigma factor (sigma-70 family)